MSRRHHRFLRLLLIVAIVFAPALHVAFAASVMPSLPPDTAPATVVLSGHSGDPCDDGCDGCCHAALADAACGFACASSAAILDTGHELAAPAIALSPTVKLPRSAGLAVDPDPRPPRLPAAIAA